MQKGSDLESLPFFYLTQGTSDRTQSALDFNNRFTIRF